MIILRGGLMRFVIYVDNVQLYMHALQGTNLTHSMGAFLGKHLANNMEVFLSKKRLKWGGLFM